MTSPVELSIVSTMYNSGATIEEFVRRATAAAEMLTSSFEIVLVDDGSPDDSLRRALAMLRHEPRLKVVELSRNFGHHKALMTGLMHARGAFCFLIDSDLEEAPELLVDFWACLHKSDLDVVYGFQAARAGDLGQRILGRVAYWLINSLSSHKIPPNHITVRLMRRDYVDALLLHREQQTAIGGLWVITGFHQQGVAVNKATRRETTYSLGMRWHRLIDSITSFSELPLIAIFYLGILVSVLSLAAAVVLVALRLAGRIGLAGWASVMVSLWLLGGILILSVGIIGVYLSRVFIETKHRPYTIVRRVHAGAGMECAS